MGVAKKLYDAPPNRDGGYPPNGMMGRYNGGSSAERYESMHGGNHGPPKDPRSMRDYPPQRHRSGERSMDRGPARRSPYSGGGPPGDSYGDFMQGGRSGGYEPGF